MRLPLKMTDNNNTSTKVEEPVQVMMEDLKKVAQGKRLAEHNHRKKEELAHEAKTQESKPKLSQAYSTGAVIAVGVLGLLGYYIYAGINSTGYHPPRANPQATNFFHQNPHPRDSFLVQNSGRRVEKNETKSPPPGIICLVRMLRYQ